ncbi:MAG: glycosyltransferase family 39 protein [Candidatus Omnitrophica bacterium]|nr:glycosyltransferase family 39 protein [Candidatus Omnitrophota bacterium]
MLTNKYDYKQILAISILLIVVTFSVYFGSLFNGFIIDDNHLIVNADVVKSPNLILKKSPHGFLNAYYRPIVVLSYAFDYFLWRLNPLGYHLTNILLHSLLALLIFIGAQLLFGQIKLAALTGILFAIHPINSVTVNYIADRANTLVAICMILALFCFCYGYKKERLHWYIGGFFGVFGAFFCRESAVIFPLYLLSVLLFIRNKEKDNQMFALFGLSSLMSIIYLIIRRTKFASIRPDGLNTYFSIEHINAFIFIIIKYLKSIFAPDNIVFYHIIDPDSLKAGNAYYLILIFLCLGFLVVKFFRNKILRFGLSWFFVGIFPLYYMMFSRHQEGLMMQDSWIYFSSAGGVLIISYILIEIGKKIDKKLWYFLLVLIIVFYARKTAAYSALWHDENTYFKYWNKVEGNTPFVGLYFADYYYKRKEYDQAIYYYEEIGDFRSAAIVALESGKLIKAAICNELAAQKNPDDPDIYLDLAYISLKLNKLNKAIYYNKKTLLKSPDAWRAHFNLSQIYFLIGQEEKANSEKAKAQAIEPEYEMILMAEGVILNR